MNKLIGNAIVGQSGGPTAAINATLVGVICGVMKTEEGKACVNKLYGMKNGIEGLLKEDIISLKEIFEDEKNVVALKHTPADKDRGEPIKVYALFKTKSGGFGFEVMSMDDVRRHAEKYSKAYSTSFSPWKTSFEEMAKKTVLKRVLKYAPLKSDFVRAMTQDETIKSTLSDDMYEVKNDVIYDAEYTDINTETGEVNEDNAV